MIKPVSAIAATIALFAALTTTAAPAVAAGSCSIFLPAKVQIASQTTVITALPGSDCGASGMSFAAWNVSPSTFGDSFLFSTGSLTSNYTFFSSLDQVGVLRAVPTGASSSELNDLTQNSPTFTVKYATWPYVSSSRSGRAVYINVLIHQWTRNDMASPGGRTVFLQRYLNGTWQNLVVRNTNSVGKITFGFVQTRVYQYRVRTTETSAAWGGYSGSTFR